jgi:hypothetical protein
MRAWDYTVHIPNTQGELARAARAFGEASLNLESVTCIEHEGTCIAHFLLADNEAPRRVLEQLGYTVVHEQEVMVEPIDDRPGILGELTHRLAEAGVNLNLTYLATGTRLVLGAPNLATLEKAWPGTVGARR